MPDNAREFDVVVIGAGAAGLFCAGLAGQRGLRVLVVDHSERVAEKLRISGGGRCNFTNRDVNANHFISQNPHFCRSALARYTPADFIALVQSHGIGYHEKHKGQLFCDRSSQDIIDMLLHECDAGQVSRWHACAVQSVSVIQAATGSRYTLETARGVVNAANVVVATGGLSIPKIAASDFGYRLAKQFGLRVVPTAPALVPLTFGDKAWHADLAGLSLPVQIETGTKKDRIAFLEDLLFTHKGLSGPAVLQISSYWQSATAIRINLAPHVDWPVFLAHAKATSQKLLSNELASQLPARLADAWVGQDLAWQRPVNQVPDKALSSLGQRLAAWELVPTGTEGYAKAEVTRGGVDTRDLSSQSMESRQPGLYFIGEVVDVTGWLGGYNFQWAWASAYACAQALAAPVTSLA